MSQQIFDQFIRHTKPFKLFITYMITFCTITTTRTFTIINQKNLLIYNMSNDNLSKKQRMINRLRNISMIDSFYKFIFIV